MLKFTEHLVGLQISCSMCLTAAQGSSAASEGLQRDGCDGLAGQAQGETRLPLGPSLQGFSGRRNERDDMG